MSFIVNAIDDGWTVKKKDASYVFTKEHHNKVQVFSDEYLDQFIKTNLKIT
jgi:hypothetical protein